MNTAPFKIGIIVLACVVLIMSVITGTVGIFAIKTMSYVVTDSQQYSFEALRCVSSAIESARTLSSYRYRIALEAENQDALEYLYAAVTSEMNILEASMENYMAYIVHEEQMRYFNEAKDVYFNQLKPQMFEMLHAAEENDMAELTELLDASSHPVNMLIPSLGMSREITEQMRYDEHYQNIHLSLTLTIVIVIVMVLTVLAAVALVVLAVFSMRTVKIQGQDAGAVYPEPPTPME